jgi:hypothetical protein
MAGDDRAIGEAARTTEHNGRTKTAIDDPRHRRQLESLRADLDRGLAQEPAAECSTAFRLCGSTAFRL